MSVRFIIEDESLRPMYATAHSAGADLKSAEDLVLRPGCTAKVRTGIKVDVSETVYTLSTIPGIFIYARSGLAAKFNISLTNGVGVVDRDYPEEICVLLQNNGDTAFKINKGDRIAQMVIHSTTRSPDFTHSGVKRAGGFGSTKGYESASDESRRPITPTRAQV